MSAGLTLSLEPIDRLRAAGFDDLLADHHAEIEDPALPLAVDWPTYYSLERNGILKIAALRRNGVLIGYSVWLLKPPLHQRNRLWGICDVLYVEPEHRGYAGTFLLRRSEQLLRDLGATVLMLTVKPRNLAGKRGRDSVGYLLSRLGYSPFEESWAKIF
jgi:GNAT superfamily N-acetyltransferase